MKYFVVCVYVGYWKFECKFTRESEALDCKEYLVSHDIAHPSDIIIEIW